MKKSVCIETLFTEVPFEERFKKAKDAGFEYVEFWSWADKDVRRIRELCAEHDLKVASFSGDRDYSPIDKQHTRHYIDFISESIRVAGTLECRYLVIHSNALGEGGVVIDPYLGKSDYQKFTTICSTLKAVSALAEKANIVLVLEALNTYSDHVGNYLTSTEQSAKVVRLVNSPALRILYDVYHMQINEGNIFSTLERYIDLIDYIHIADVPGRHEPGTGEINFPGLLKKVDELGYKGYLGFELFPAGTPEQAVQAIMSL